MNEQLVLRHIRAAGELSRPDLARMSGLSKPTVSLTLANLERGRAGADRRASAPACRGRLPCSTRCDPRPGFVLGLDVGQQYLRGAICDLSGAIRARETVKVEASSGSGRVAELAGLAELLYAKAAVPRPRSPRPCSARPGVYDPVHKTLALTGALPGWERPADAGRVCRCLRGDADGRERRRRGRAGRASARPRPRRRQLRVRLDRHRHRHGSGARRSAAPRRTRCRG